MSTSSPARRASQYGPAEEYGNGDGVSPVGVFTLAGRYDAEANEMQATLIYPGSHETLLKGYRDNRGIWGLWQIPGDSSGGFHIWPRGQGTGSGERAAAAVDVPAPSTPP